LARFNVQRASRSFSASLAGLSFQSSGIWPSLIAFFSSSAWRCRGAATIVASGDRALKPQAQKPHERQPVAQLEFGRVVRQCVERLQDQDLEHQYGVIGRSTALRPVGTIQRLGQRRTKHLEVDQRRKADKRIADLRELAVAVIQIEQSTLAN
jgi:hypothetical protein